MHQAPDRLPCTPDVCGPSACLEVCRTGSNGKTGGDVSGEGTLVPGERLSRYGVASLAGLPARDRCFPARPLLHLPGSLGPPVFVPVALTGVGVKLAGWFQPFAGSIVL